ncbi:MAG: hypothetical protein LBJ72_03660 [Dysgonamonadaceae bacterium]|nr:hypothetical protein [Dysgonamonadaceae bacterium]
MSKGYANTIDLSNAKVVCCESKDKLVLKSVAVLQEEIEKRSGIALPLSRNWPKGKHPIIAVGLEHDLTKFPVDFRNLVSQMDPAGSEGYKIAVDEKSTTVLVIGYDSRGVLYGIGKLLRKMEMQKGRVLAPADMNISSTPQYPIRGHQLGYRAKTNSYDAWTPAQFDSYIRDLAIFGANSIEIVPPYTDDKSTSINMKLPVIDMMVEQSKIAASYGMDVWIWYPNMETDYTNPDIVAKELEDRRTVFKTLPKLDCVFVPGGDPGELDPDIMFPWLANVAEVLQEYHPHAKIWVSPQIYRPTNNWLDKIYSHINKGYNWLGGVVYGPWVKHTIMEVRERIVPEIPIRRYEDITHSMESQYPIPKWDLAYAITLGRECINPRPNDEKKIHNVFAPYAQGSISYSEGSNDDVNKMVWSDQDWNVETPVIETIRDYVRYFIGCEYVESVTQGLMALEKNLQGSLLSNDGVMRTLLQWQDIEKNASDEVLCNPRFQMGLIRAYYDAYIYRRLLYETCLEQEAYEILSKAGPSGSLSVVRKAKETLLKAAEQKVAIELRERCFALADSLYKSIGAQLTVERLHGQDGRGNFIDYIDFPLNDARWLSGRLSEIEQLPDESIRLKEITKILNRNNPGPGGFYDNMGSPQSWERVKSNFTWEEDPGGLRSPRVGYGIGLYENAWMNHINARDFENRFPLSWMNQIVTFHDVPLIILYDNIDPESAYTLRVTYTGSSKPVMKLTANDVLIHDFIKTGIQAIYEFPIPAGTVNKDGILKLVWTCGEGQIGPAVSEIWIIKNE